MITFMTAVLAAGLVQAPPTPRAPAPGADVDTTFAVPARGRLAVEVMHGTVMVTAWDRDAMRIRSPDGRRGRVEIRRRGNTVSVEPEGIGFVTNLEITVPRGFQIDLEGVNLRAAVDGVAAAVKVENVEGRITVSNVTGAVEVESVSGDVIVTGVRGAVSVNTTNQTIRLEGVSGPIEAETVNGSITMRRIDSNDVQASTVQGVVEYEGTIRDDGRYYLGTHNGRITLAVPEQTNARIEVSTHNGSVEAAFPVQINSTRREHTVTFGRGSARVELETFNGSVQLVRPSNR